MSPAIVLPPRSLLLLDATHFVGEAVVANTFKWHIAGRRSLMLRNEASRHDVIEVAAQTDRLEGQESLFSAHSTDSSVQTLRLFYHQQSFACWLPAAPSSATECRPISSPVSATL